MSFINSLLRLFGNKKPSFSFPSIIKGECENAKNSSRDKIQRRGYTLREKQSCRVVLEAGTKVFANGWAKEINGRWCHGYYDGNTIFIFCNPKRKTDINAKTLEHEFAHYWLVSNFGNWTHDRLLDDLFFGWGESRRITGKGSNKIFHYDFIEEENK